MINGRIMDDPLDIIEKLFGTTVSPLSSPLFQILERHRMDNLLLIVRMSVTIYGMTEHAIYTLDGIDNDLE
jgi:hypothetical protein